MSPRLSGVNFRLHGIPFLLQTMRYLAVLYPPCTGIIGSSKPRFLLLHHLLRRSAKGSLGLRCRAPLKGTRVAASSKPPPSPVSDSDQQPQISGQLSYCGIFLRFATVSEVLRGLRRRRCGC